MIVAKRAEDILSYSNPTVFENALTELKTLKNSQPNLTFRENLHPFTECASFADDIKDQNMGIFTGWHFID